MFPRIGVPQNGWFTMENLIKMDDLGVPPFEETSKWFNLFTPQTRPGRLTIGSGFQMRPFYGMIDDRCSGANGWLVG